MYDFIMRLTELSARYFSINTDPNEWLLGNSIRVNGFELDQIYHIKFLGLLIDKYSKLHLQ